MRFPERFNRAIDKLYAAFHNGSLNAECCKHCAVGNICDNTDGWKYFTDQHGSTQLNYVGLVNESFGKKFFGYSPGELLQIEAVFLKGCGYSLPFINSSSRPQNHTSKDVQFKGLCAVVAFLCKLEGIPDIMDYENLFDFSNPQPCTEGELVNP